jgi:hypothetical protein
MFDLAPSLSRKLSYRVAPFRRRQESQFTNSISNYNLNCEEIRMDDLCYLHRFRIARFLARLRASAERRTIISMDKVVGNLDWATSS